MADFFVDHSAAVNGSGSMAAPFNNLNTVTLASNNTYWIRRVEGLVGNRSYTMKAIPTNTNIVGWPVLGDLFFPTRPANATWDADIEEHAILYVAMNVNIVHTVLLHRLYINIPSTVTFPNVGFSDAAYIRVFNSSVVNIDHCKIEQARLRNGAGGSISGIRLNTSRRCTITNTTLLDYGAQGIDSDALLYIISCQMCMTDVTHRMINNTNILPYTSGGADNIGHGHYYIGQAMNCVVKVKVVATGPITPFATTARRIKAFYVDGGNKSTFSVDLTEHPTTIEPMPVYIFNTTAVNHKVYVKGPRVGNIYNITGGTTMHVNADEIIGRTFGVIPNTFSVGHKDIVTVHPYTEGGTVSITAPTGPDILLWDGASGYIHHLAKHPTLSVGGNLPDMSFAYRLPDDTLFFRSRTGSAMSTNIKRQGKPNGFRVRLDNVATGLSGFTSIGNDFITPYNATMTANPAKAIIHMAGIINNGKYIRPGDVVLLVYYIDSKGPQLAIGSKLTYTASVWEGVSNYKPCYIEANISPDMACDIRAILRFSYADRYQYVIADNAMEVIYD